MCQKMEPKSLQAFFLPNGAVAALAVLVLLFGFALDAAAQQSTGSADTAQQEQVEQAVQAPFIQHIPKGYSTEGPLRILSATTQAIKFYTVSEKLAVTLELKGLQVSVRDENNNALSLDALVKGTRVTVSRSPDKKIVIVFVTPSTVKEKRDDL